MLRLIIYVSIIYPAWQGKDVAGSVDAGLNREQAKRLMVALVHLILTFGNIIVQIKRLEKLIL
ncbi:hypothetical protein BAU28_03240 [Bacillus paramycoides]|uniref:Uncharacterized protein n=1 Tax=Bacillus paramycoides TaxID=2026194 RepID=A0A1J9UHC1_9BACI|nr:hypothetical protein BAU28_03240 [Bacillus paramycoides]